MAESLFSPSWYRVAELKPRMRNHVEIHRHEYRGRIWFILQDHVGGRSHRFSPAVYRFIGLMDGHRNVEELWQTMNTQTGDEAPTQDEVIRLLGQLHTADALICDTTPDSMEVLRRYQRLERMRWKQKIWTPLAVRIPVLDPDRFLERTYPYVGWIFGRMGALLWLAVVLTGTILAAVHWGELTNNIVDRTLSPENLFLLWFVYPVVKAFHELGHGYAIKKGGGEVHEIGIMFLVLVPVPYVDASSASGFRDKHQRMLVGAAGIVVELFLGSLALFVWLNAQSGAVHAIAYNVMLISGVSTLLFNGNPLLRFDGYYVLLDAIEIPNLGTRSTKYLGYLVQRYLFAKRDAESPADSKGEQWWFFFYGVAAFIYRIFIMFAIILYVGGKFFAVGILLALWAIVTMVVVPVSKSLSFVFSSPRLRRQRGRSVGMTVGLTAGLLALLFILPIPHFTKALGVTWPSEQSQIRTGAEGIIVQLATPVGSPVEAGQTLIETRDPFIETRLKVLEANRKELEAQLLAVQGTDRVQTDIISQAVATVDASLKVTKDKINDLMIRSPRAGTLVVPGDLDLPGRHVSQGQILGYVIQPTDPVTLRVVVSQDEIGLVRGQTKRVTVMPRQWRGNALDAEILREVPGGSERLPTAALGTQGGGSIPVSPGDPEGRQTMQRVFELEIALSGDIDTELLGARMHVRFDHGYEPAGVQVFRALRQLFLRRFSV